VGGTSGPKCSSRALGGIGETADMNIVGAGRNAGEVSAAAEADDGDDWNIPGQSMNDNET
jgi:hypothetical protein